MSLPYECTRWSSVNVLSQLQVDSEDLTLPPSVERLHYQRDPRPHFGVAHSTRSVSSPLWDSYKPREMKRGEEEKEEEEETMESVSSCPHCHLGLLRDTLRWHEVSRHATQVSFRMQWYYITLYIAKNKVIYPHTHTHTHTHTNLYGLRGLSIGVMVFILYKPYFLRTYNNPTPKPTPLCIFTFSKKLILYDL